MKAVYQWARWIGMGLGKSWRLQVMFFLPLCYFLVFKYYPMYGAQIAFKKYNLVLGITGSRWVGFDQFVRFFDSYEFYRVLKNTLGLAIYDLFVSFPFPILLALGINYVSNAKFKKSVQMITYAPHFISVVVMVGILLQLLNPRIGLFNQILELFGMEPVHFMSKTRIVQVDLCFSGIWQNVGWGCIIYLAALASIDPTLHEAAVMDGASKLRRMWHVDLPGILPVAIILFILNIGNLMDTGFEKVLLLQNPLNLSTSEVIDTFVYKIGLASALVDFSYASAIGLFKSMINLMLLIFVNYSARRLKQESLW